MTNEKFCWVEITNPRAEREFNFLVSQVGEEKIIAARALLGARKAFPLNLARLLGVKLPAELSFMPVAEIKEKIQDLRRRLVGAGDGEGEGVRAEGKGSSVAPTTSLSPVVKEDGHA